MKQEPVFPRGSGTSNWGAVPSKGAIVIDMAKMNEVIKIDEEVLTCVTQPNITFGQLDAVRRKSGYRFLVSPENSCLGQSADILHHMEQVLDQPPMGFRKIAYLVLKWFYQMDNCWQQGLHAPFHSRHYAPYAFANNLAGLFCGSEGTLGTITWEVALKIERLPEAMEFLAFKFNSFESGCEAYNDGKKGEDSTDSIVLEA